MIISEKDLGELKLVPNARAKGITARFRDGRFYISYPSFLDVKTVEKTLAEMKPRLIRLKSNSAQRQPVSQDSPFVSLSFRTEIAENSLTNYYMRLKGGILYLSYPYGVDPTSDDAQSHFRKLIEKALRYEAKRILTEKVEASAREHGFVFSEVKINKSRTRWGSCSAKRSINLSYYCMLLPEYLADFVVLHELCHTVEMNHGERFWQLLDKVSGGNSANYTSQLKKYKTDW